MCGINGLAGFNDKNLVRKMNALIRHRGPDQDGYFSGNKIDMGMQRLSIVDVKHGRQPLYNEDQSIAVIFNGEIYNYKTLKKELEEKGHSFYTDSDTEVIAHGHEEWGSSLPNYLNGMFAYAVWDEARRSLTLARDRFGKKPLYYYADKNVFLFSSEIKSFLSFPEFKKDLDYQAIRNYLNLRFIPGPRTIFSHVKKLLPGHQLVWKNHSFQTSSYWKMPFYANNYSFEEACGKIQDSLFDATSSRLMSEVPLGAFLSGGLDSATIVAIMSRFVDTPVKTFSIGFPNTEFDESDLARENAEQIGTDHTTIFLDENALDLLNKIVWHADEPLADPTCIPTYVLAREAKKEITVVLTGEGADELFGGYEQYKVIHNTKLLRHVPRFFKTTASKIVSAFPKSFVNRFFKYYSVLGAKGVERFEEFASHAVNMPKSYFDLIEIFTNKEVEQVSEPTFLNKSFYEVEQLGKKFMHSPATVLKDMQFFELGYSLPDNLLMKTDKMCMAASVEARCPYLDYRLAEKVFNLPDKYKILGLKDKLVLRKIAHSLGLTASRRKKARFFVPLNHWFSGDLKEVLAQTTDKQALQKRGFFKFDVVQKILNTYSSSPAYNARQLWVLACLELWHQQYVDR